MGSYAKGAVLFVITTGALWITTLGGLQAEDAVNCDADSSPSREIVDMAGRVISLPTDIHGIATVGSVPVLNGYLFALGAGQRIANDLPYRFSASGRWKLHHAIAPYLLDRPVIQGQAGNEVSIEKLLQADPDVVVTMDRYRIASLAKTGIPVVYLEWKDRDDIRKNIRILGCMMNRVSQGEDYLDYLDETMNQVSQILENVGSSERPRVLYFNPHNMSTPLVIANWWIEQAGGRSVATDMGPGSNVQYSHEQVLIWNPDILIVNSPEQIVTVYEDERFANINAVKNRQVHVIPMGAHSWGQRTVEQPLTVRWAAELFHPAAFEDADIDAEVRQFYERFFDHKLSREEIRAMFQGRSTH